MTTDLVRGRRGHDQLISASHRFLILVRLLFTSGAKSGNSNVSIITRYHYQGIIQLAIMADCVAILPDFTFEEQVGGIPQQSESDHS